MKNAMNQVRIRIKDPYADDYGSVFDGTRIVEGAKIPFGQTSIAIFHRKDHADTLVTYNPKTGWGDIYLRDSSVRVREDGCDPD